MILRNLGLSYNHSEDPDVAMFTFIPVMVKRLVEDSANDVRILVITNSCIFQSVP